MPKLSANSTEIEDLVELLLEAVCEKHDIAEDTFYKGPKVPTDINNSVIPSHEIIHQHFIKRSIDTLTDLIYFGCYEHLKTLHPAELVHQAIIKCMYLKDIKYFIKVFKNKDPEIRTIEYYLPIKNQDQCLFNSYTDTSPSSLQSSTYCNKTVEKPIFSFLEGFDFDTILTEDSIFYDSKENYSNAQPQNSRKESNFINKTQNNNIKVEIDNLIIEKYSLENEELSKTDIKKQKKSPIYFSDYTFGYESNLLELKTQSLSCEIKPEKDNDYTVVVKERSPLLLSEEAFSLKINENFNPLCCLISENQIVFSNLGKTAIEIMKESSSRRSKKLFLNYCKRSFYSAGIRFSDVLKMVNILGKEQRIDIITDKRRAMKLDLTYLDDWA